MILLMGIALLLVGFGFKVSSVPFHMWAPDVYDGSPNNVTAYMAATVKAAAFAAFLRVWLEAFPGEAASWDRTIELLERLRQGCPEFAGWWEAHDIKSVVGGQKLLNHPRKGLLRFEHASFQANDDPALKLIIYTPV